MGTTTTDRSRECEAYLDSLQHTPPDLLSACTGWTAHEVTAHLAATAAEVTRHLRPYLAGDPVPATRSFEEREPAYRALGDTELARGLEDEEQVARALLDEVLAAEPEAVIPWTGRHMAVAKFVPHLRNEFAIHRWDLVGDDDTGDELLAQPELTRHSVGELGEILTRRGRAHDPDPDRDFRVRLHAEGATDLLLVVDGGRAALELAEDGAAGEPALEMDAVARTLFIWGRRAGDRHRVRAHLDQPTLARIQALLAGY
jgi:hypothetical protein